MAPQDETVARGTLQVDRLAGNSADQRSAQCPSLHPAAREASAPLLDRWALDPDNNATERVIRGVVLGRTNHQGSRSERGTQVAALLYSLIDSAQLADLNPHDYLRQAVHAALDGVQIPLPHEIR